MRFNAAVDGGQWVYERSADGAARFVLGVAGKNPLICFGVNPSVAVPGAPDQTIRRLSRFATDNGYDSWTMLNLYPQISTDPRGMDREFREELKATNEEHIARMLDSKPASVLAAWGGTIRTRRYLPGLLHDIVQLTTSAGTSWLSLDAPLTDGHPRHPSRARVLAQLQVFDIERYLLQL